MSLDAGTRLGPYEITSPIGSGGMGNVYRARDTRLGRDVPVKVLRAAVAGDPNRQARFEREARVNRDQTVEVPDSASAEGPFFSPDAQ
jgi:serine/threonine protein kinase